MTTRTMKSFRLYVPKPAAVTRFVTDYTAEEQHRFRETFRTIAERYRLRGRILGFVLSIAFASIITGFILRSHQTDWVLPVFFVCWLVGMALILFGPRLDCPACSNDVERGFGPFCPECGSRSLQPGGWFRAPECTACGRTMRRGKGRHYKIRACTYCGLMLDEQGL